jgi:hypothetical protein
MILTYTEQLIEAVSYAEEENEDWWELFDSAKQAKTILTGAKREGADEYQMLSMLTAREIDVDMFGPQAVEEAYRALLNELRQELEE